MSGSTAAFQRSIEIAIRSDLSPAAAALDFAQRVREDVAAEIAAKRAAPTYTRYVDGKPDLPETAVKPGGSIFYEFGMMAELVVFALAFLRARSPTGGAPRPGKAFPKPYRESFWTSIRGKFIAPGDLNPANIPEGEEIVIGNMQPYNRKVDVQLIGRKPLRFSVPADLFGDAARAVNKQFGNFVQARRLYDIDFRGKPKLQQSQARRGTPWQIRRWAGTHVESPALVITPRR